MSHPIFRIGNIVYWTTESYWSKHPNESGYETENHSGRVVSFDETTVAVWGYSRMHFLNIKNTNWVEVRQVGQPKEQT